MSFPEDGVVILPIATHPPIDHHLPRPPARPPAPPARPAARPPARPTARPLPAEPTLPPAPPRALVLLLLQAEAVAP